LLQWYVYMFCIVTVVRVHVLYCYNGTCTCSVLWEWYVYMFCIVTEVRVHVLHCDIGTCTCSVLWQRYMYIFCTVTVLSVHVLYSDSGKFTCSVLWQRYRYIFCIVTVVYEKMFGKQRASQPQLLFLCNSPSVMWKLQNYAAHHVLCNMKTHRL